MKPESPFFEECAAVLNASLLFSPLDAPGQRSMLRLYRRETWAKGARLPPDQANRFFTILVSGRLELTRTNPETGRQVTLFTLLPGDAFDIVSLLDGKDHDVDPIALEPVAILTAPIEKARAWMETRPAILRSFLPYLGEKIRDLENRSADLALYETVKRLAMLILQQAVPDPPRNASGGLRPLLVNTLTDEAMARMIGSVRGVVNRHIQELTQLGLIATSRGRLVVRDLEKLREFCERVQLV